MANTTPNRMIQRIICSWSRTLELDQVSGESIVTQVDLDRVIRVLSQYFGPAESKNSYTQILHDSNIQ